MAAERSRRSVRNVATRSGRQHKSLKMTALEARHGPARPPVRRWLASFLIDFLVLR